MTLEKSRVPLAESAQSAPARESIWQKKAVFEQAVSNYCRLFFEKFPGLNVKSALSAEVPVPSENPEGATTPVSTEDWIFAQLQREDLSPHQERIFIQLLARNPRKSLRRILQNPDSDEFKINFLLFVLITELRSVLIRPAILEEQLELAKSRNNESVVAQTLRKMKDLKEREAELRTLISIPIWKKSILRVEANGGNKVAYCILCALGEYASMAEDALRELRHRLQRGALQRNDPWWPTY